ncbi:DEAD-domain-containing protein [Schizophyllum commune H4-8]|nr:DEAD-domain-containing protein [Schizophyllum commune H4-8]KAI5885129.1 DEAD-domain-containing protein [Schizophyllum commune H4-8]
MSNEAAVKKEKKERKERKEKKHEVKKEAATETEDVEMNLAVEDEAARKKREKKEKKDRKREEKERKRKLEEAESAEKQDAAGEPEKRKKKKKHGEEDVKVEATEDGAQPTKEKKKKRKHEDVEPTTSAEVDAKAEKKSKKKAKLAAAASSSAVATSTSASTSSAPITTTSAPSPAEIESFLAKHAITIHTPDGVPRPTPVVSFAQLAVPDEIRKSFKGFKEPTPIQACTWPPALEGRDVVGIAETGSGKTLAFGIPLLNRLITSRSTTTQSAPVTALVVAPTRELAIQTHDTLSALGKPFGIASVAVFGGVPKEPQVRMLRNANKGKDGMTTRVVVGTPGRILDLMNDGACDLGNVDYLVLDEADRMLDKGFENDIRNIISATKPLAERQTLMFSATWPDSVRKLASTFQNNPVRVTVGSDDLTANSRVEQIVEVLDDGRQKDSRLTALLRNANLKKVAAGMDESRVLVFALYKKECSRVEQNLRRQGFSVGGLSGDMSQSARIEALEAFKTGKTNLLVATDVAARGLDIANVGLVVNYTFPLTIEDYIHRIGRTGRGGKSGKSITFFTGEGHERALAGELARVLHDSGFECEGLKKFPMTIKKKEHSVYGAFYRDDIQMPKAPTKLTFT